MRAMESTRKKLEASEEKRFWRQVLLKWWRHQKHVIISKITKGKFHQKICRSSGAADHQKLKELKLQKAVQRIQSRLSLQKTRRMKQRPIQMDLKSLDAYSLKRVEKEQLYELYNHYLHYSVLYLQQDKNNSYACTRVPPDLEWIWNWSFIGQ